MRLFLALVFVSLVSCSDIDYLNAIPDDCMALMAVDAPKVASQTKYGLKANVLLSMLKVVDPVDCGVDLTSKMYLFETAEGNFGMTARVSSEKSLVGWMDKLSARGQAEPVSEKSGFHFTVLKNNWVVGFSSHAVVLMGPAIGSAQRTLRQQITRLLAQGDDEGAKDTRMFLRLDSLNGAMVMVAQAQALPAQFASLLTLGAPRDADASQVVLAASLSVTDGCLDIDGEIFSFNKRVDEAIRKSSTLFRPVKGQYAGVMPSSSAVGLFVNVRGTDFLTMLQQNREFSALLTGVNTAVDMDNIIRSVDGDLVLSMPGLGQHNAVCMAAKLSDTRFTADIDYWKQSCPEGGQLIDTGTTSWCYSNGSKAFHFGVTPDNQFFSGPTAQYAQPWTASASGGLNPDIYQRVEGKKMAIVVNLQQSDNEMMQTINSLLTPLFGKVDNILFSRN